MIYSDDEKNILDWPTGNYTEKQYIYENIVSFQKFPQAYVIWYKILNKFLFYLNIFKEVHNITIWAITKNR